MGGDDSSRVRLPSKDGGDLEEEEGVKILHRYRDHWSPTLSQAAFLSLSCINVNVNETGYVSTSNELDLRSSLW